MWRELSWKYGWTSATWCAVVVAMSAFLAPVAQAAAADNEITYTKDIAPILQRSCQNCHRPDGVAPMALITYEEVRPWARAIKQRTGIGPHAGVMPPWYVEKNIGIQEYQNDPSLSDEEIAKIAQVGRQRRAARQSRPTCRRPKSDDDGKSWTIGDAGSDRQAATERHREGERA